MGGVPLPEGYHSVNPYIVVDDAERLIGFLAQVFGAVEQGPSLCLDGRIDHGDVRIGDSLVMLSEASQKYPARPCIHFVYVPDVDITYRAALAAGATSILEPTRAVLGRPYLRLRRPVRQPLVGRDPSASVLLDRPPPPIKSLLEATVLRVMSGGIAAQRRGAVREARVLM